MKLHDADVTKFLSDPEKRSVIYGTLLGDATLTYIPPGKYGGADSYRASKSGKDGTCYVRIKHAADQKSLVEHKHSVLKDVAGDIWIQRPANLKWQDSHGFYTKNSLEWLEVYKELYSDSREVVGKTGHVQRFKRLTPEILDKLDDRGLAWWIMDDGCYSISGSGFFRMSTQAYTVDEHEMIRAWLEARYGVRSSLNCCAKKGVRLATYDSYVLYIGEKQFDKIRQRVKSYVIADLQYKLGL